MYSEYLPGLVDFTVKLNVNDKQRGALSKLQHFVVNQMSRDIMFATFIIWSFYANFHRVWFFFAPLAINMIRWPFWFRQFVSFRIIPRCEWSFMFPFPFSIPLVSWNYWGRHDIVNLRSFLFVWNSLFWFFLLWDCIRVSLGSNISMGKQVSIALGLKINMGKQASSREAKRNKSANITDWYKCI